MPKGFVVKAKQEEPKQEWDFDKIKQRMRGRTIAICVPGRQCSMVFMKAMIRLCFDLANNGTAFHLFQDYSSMVNFARCKVLGANVLRGPNQKPWNGELEYDWQLWIDSDIVFDSDCFWKLCDLAFPEEALIQETNEIDETKIKKIASGWYCTEDGHSAAVSHWLEEDDFRKNGGVMKNETVETLAARKKPFTADYVGFGWVMIRKGVFESLPYPWFAPKLQIFENGEVQDMCGEDVSFCLDAKKNGFEVWCDPRIRVGHEKIRCL